MLEQKPFYSPREVAELAGLSVSTVLSYIRSGKLHAVKLSERVYRIPLATVLRTFFPVLKPPPVFRRATGAEATWRRWMSEAHAGYEAKHKSQRAPRSRRAAARA